MVALLDSGVDREVGERAAELRVHKPSPKMPDALILATADLRHADLVITADDRWTGAGIGARVE